METKYPVLALLIAATLSGCGKPKIPTVANDEGHTAAPMASVVRMNDATVARQLLTGFYPPENNAWRWAAKNFTVALHVPAGAAQRGAGLNLALSIPDAVITAVGPVTLKASIGGKMLNTATWNAPGAYTFTSDVPPELLSGDTVKAEFSVDKSLPPAPGGDRRELALIVSSVSLAVH